VLGVVDEDFVVGADDLALGSIQRFELLVFAGAIEVMGDA
jgi:hypothetical protein